jgi:hypothetical protein
MTNMLAERIEVITTEIPLRNVHPARERSPSPENRISVYWPITLSIRDLQSRDPGGMREVNQMKRVE